MVDETVAGNLEATKKIMRDLNIKNAILEAENKRMASEMSDFALIGHMNGASESRGVIQKLTDENKRFKSQQEKIVAIIDKHSDCKVKGDDAIGIIFSILICKDDYMNGVLEKRDVMLAYKKIEELESENHKLKHDTERFFELANRRWMKCEKLEAENKRLLFDALTLATIEGIVQDEINGNNTTGHTLQERLCHVLLKPKEDNG